MKQPILAILGSLAAILPSCGGGGGGGGGGGPVVRPNAAPILLTPAGLTGLSPRFTFSLPTADTASLLFAATDGDGDPLQWQLTVTSADAIANGLAFQSPQNGGAFALALAPVTATAATQLQLLVEDAFGGAAAIDLTIARTGAPTLVAVSPVTAFAGQPQLVTLTGTGLRLGGTVSTAVTFGGLSATEVVVVDDSTLRCKTPSLATAPGPTIVGVSHRFGSAALAASAFTMFRYPPRFAATDQRLDSELGVGGTSGLHLASDGLRAHAVFVDGGRLDYRGSIDGGVTFAPAEPLSGAEIASEPQVFGTGDDVAAAWIGDGTAVLVRRSIDGGVSWLPAVRLDVVTLPESTSSRPRLCGDGARRYVAWLEGEPLLLAARVTASASADSGATWTAAQRVGSGTANQGRHEIACLGARAWLVFEDDRSGPALRGVFANRTIDGGSTWNDDKRLSRTDSAASGPRLCAEGQAVHVVWAREGGVYHNSSQNSGASWQTAEDQVRGAEVGALTGPDVCCSGNRVHVIYVAAGTNVWVSKSSDGTSFPDQIPVDTGLLPAAQVRIAGVGEYVFAAWRRGDPASGAARIVHAQSTNGGTIYAAATGLGNGTAAQGEAQLVTGGARLLLGWIDGRGALPGAFVNATTP